MVSLLLPHSAKGDVPNLYSNTALAYVGGILVWVLGSRFRMWMAHAMAVIGALLITRSMVLSGEPVSFYSVWLIWVGLYAFYFFSRRAAAIHVAFVAVLYAFTLVHAPASSPVARWLTTVATLIVAGVFIDTLVRRARRQASVAEASANTMSMAAEVAHRLARLADPETARSALCLAASEATQADGVALWEPTADGVDLRVSAATGRRLELPEMAIDDSEIAIAGPLPAGTLCKPIVRRGRTMGALAFHWEKPAALENPSIVTLSDLLAAEAAAALERLELLSALERIARTDELTGLPNRRAWQEQLPRELARARRTGHAVCVAMLDLDHFKRYNDRSGHLAGDRLLERVAATWSSQLRPMDLLARYGGEEFSIALPGCTELEALDVIERVRKSTPLQQTCSSGIALWDGRESAEQLLERADDALYQAKRLGRNQTSFSDPASAAT